MDQSSNLRSLNQIFFTKTAQIESKGEIIYPIMKDYFTKKSGYLQI